jgi:hypothetical protein
VINENPNVTQSELSPTVMASVISDLGTSTRSVVSSIANFYQGALIQLLANATVLNTQASLADGTAATQVNVIESPLDLVLAWNETQKDNHNNEPPYKWFINFCSNAMPGSWEPTDVLYNDINSLANAPNLLRLLDDENPQLLDLCTSLKVNTGDIRELLMQYLEYQTGFREPEIKKILPTHASVNQSIHETLLRAYSVLELEGFDPGEYAVLRKLQETPSAEMSAAVESFLGPKLPEFMIMAKEMLSSIIKPSLEESESVVLTELIKTLQNRVKQATVIKEMTAVLVQDFGDVDQLRNNNEIFDTIIGRFKEHLVNGQQRLSEVDEKTT